MDVTYSQTSSVVKMQRCRSITGNNGLGAVAVLASDLPITCAAGFNGAGLTRSVTGQRQRGIANGQSILERSAAQSCFMIPN